MCQICLDSMQEIFPEVPEAELGDFLMAATCFPFGEGEDTRKQLLDLRARMTTNDYHECYAIAEADLDEEVAQAERDGVWPGYELTHTTPPAAWWTM